jgi:hypothetical protein
MKRFKKKHLLILLVFFRFDKSGSIADDSVEIYFYTYNSYYSFLYYILQSYHKIKTGYSLYPCQNDISQRTKGQEPACDAGLGRCIAGKLGIFC